MSHRICLCPASIAWIRRHLKKSARATFTRLLSKGSIAKITRRRKGRRKGKSRKHRTAKQRAATRKLVAFNKRRRR